MKKKIAIALCVIMLAGIAGCKAYTEHEKKYKAAVGTWRLDCVYLDTVPVDFAAKDIVLNKDETGEYRMTTVVTPAQENSDGTTTPAVTEQSSVPFQVELGGEGELFITANGDRVQFTFSVDEPAGLLHMFTTAENGQEYHYIYINVEELGE